MRWSSFKDHTRKVHWDLRLRTLSRSGHQDEYQNDTYKRRVRTVAVSDFNMLGRKGFKKINVDFVDFSDEGVKDDFYRVVD